MITLLGLKHRVLARAVQMFGVDMTFSIGRGREGGRGE